MNRIITIHRRAILATDNSPTNLSSASALFERPQTGERSVLVHIDFYNSSVQDELEELCSLAISAGADPVAVIDGKRNSPDARIFVGKGKLEEISRAVNAYNADLVIFNHQLSPSQERNIERELKCRVLDRAGLILDIFAQRARTFEGKLQVELAQLRHMSTRLVRGWTHLERQKGGIGLRGPGETQLETDRRLLAIRIKQLGKRLEKVRKQRDQGRNSRRRNDVPSVALVGYTNAGKSTLFNTLTESGVYAADQLFATLDPTLRKLQLSSSQNVVLVDTVGFINHLPHELIAAFRATLEETCEADLILHVVDASDELREDRIDQVNEVLRSIGADKVPQVMVMNKIDLQENSNPRHEKDRNGNDLIWVSAQESSGMKLLREALQDRFLDIIVEGTIAISPQDGKLRSRLYSIDGIISEEHGDDGIAKVKIAVPQKIYNQLHKEFNIKLRE